MTEGLACTCRIPLAWQVEEIDDETRTSWLGEAAFLLAALNQMESAHELESSGGDNRRLDRLEAKLDLVLHLLTRALDTAPSPPRQAITLTPEGAEWATATPPAAGAAVTLEVRLFEMFPITLRLPTRALPAGDGRARVAFDRYPENLDNALYQFVFRRHRQAIRSKV